MKKLYICEYPSVLYKTLIERMCDEENSYSLILSDARADLEPMVPVLRQSGLFERVEFFSSAPYKNYYDILTSYLPQSLVARYLKLLKNQLKMALYQKRFKEINFPFEIDFREYDKIICIDHPYVINGYLNMNHIEYAIVEHGKSLYKRSTYPKAAAAYLYAFGILDKLHILPGIRTASRFCKEVIVDDATDISYCLHDKKITGWSVDEHINALDSEQKNRIFQLYAEAYGVKIDIGQTYDLLLTNPLFRDGFLPSEEKQIKLYKDLIRERLISPVLIKPHPRDTVDYKKYFSDCIVIDKSISSEILNFSQDLRLSTVLTVFSSSGPSFREKAEKVVMLEEFQMAAHQIETLKPYQ